MSRSTTNFTFTATNETTITTPHGKPAATNYALPNDGTHIAVENLGRELARISVHAAGADAVVVADQSLQAGAHVLLARGNATHIAAYAYPTAILRVRTGEAVPVETFTAVLGA